MVSKTKVSKLSVMVRITIVRKLSWSEPLQTSTDMVSKTIVWKLS